MRESRDGNTLALNSGLVTTSIVRAILQGQKMALLFAPAPKSLEHKTVAASPRLSMCALQHPTTPSYPPLDALNLFTFPHDRISRPHYVIFMQQAKIFAVCRIDRHIPVQRVVTIAVAVRERLKAMAPTTRSFLCAHSVVER